MQKLLSYKILNDYKLVVIYYQGKVSASDIYNLLQKLVEEPTYSRKYDVINDFSNCTITAKAHELQEFVKSLKYNLNYFDQRRAVFLTNKPNEVVLTTLYSEITKRNEIKPIICSTIDAAIQFFPEKEISAKFIDSIIKSIQKESIV